MKRRGFTLIELLAVMIVLTIIAAVAFVLIGRFVEGSKQKVFIANTNEIIKKLDLDRSENAITVNNSYTILNNEISEDNTNRKINLKNLDGITGKIYYDENGEYTLLIKNDKYCTRKNATDRQIQLYLATDSNCSLG